MIYFLIRYSAQGDDGSEDRDIRGRNLNNIDELHTQENQLINTK